MGFLVHEVNIIIGFERRFQEAGSTQRQINVPCLPIMIPEAAIGIRRRIWNGLLKGVDISVLPPSFLSGDFANNRISELCRGYSYLSIRDNLSR